jgi:hypothetical protein
MTKDEDIIAQTIEQLERMNRVLEHRASANPNGMDSLVPTPSALQAFGCAKFLSPFPKRLKSVTQPSVASGARLERPSYAG